MGGQFWSVLDGLESGVKIRRTSYDELLEITFRRPMI